MEERGSQWTELYEISYPRIFRNSVEKLQFQLEEDKNKEHFTWKQ